MRIAVLADIHGNLPALDAVLTDLAGRGADRIVNLGDVASGPLWPRETIARLLPLDWPTVRGNHDRWLAELPEDKMGASDRYAFAETDAGQRAWLRTLPPRLDLGGGVIAFHASPGDDCAYLLDEIVDGHLVDATEAVVAARLGSERAAVVLTGHSHRSGMLALGDGRLVVNPGSVGLPAYDDLDPPAHVSESGTPHARYAILDVGAKGLATVERIALGYDHEMAARRAEQNARPEWAYALRSGLMPPSSHAAVAARKAGR